MRVSDMEEKKSVKKKLVKKETHSDTLNMRNHPSLMEELRAAAHAADMPVVQYVTMAIKEKMARDE